MVDFGQVPRGVQYIQLGFNHGTGIEDSLNDWISIEISKHAPEKVWTI